MSEKKKIIQSFCAVILTVCMFCSSLVPVHAAEYVDDLELVDYIDDIVVDGEQALVSYSIPIDPFCVFRGRTPDGSVKLIGSGPIVNMSQDITTNTYQSFQSSLVLGNFTVKDNGDLYYWQMDFNNFELFRNITHAFIDGVFYEVGVSDNGYRLTISVYGDSGSFVNCYYYYDNSDYAPKDLLRIWFSEPGEHTVLFGTTVDVTEVVREYDSIFGNIFPLGVQSSSYRVIDVSDLKSGASFDFSYTYDFLWQVTGTAGPLSSGFTAYFLDEDFELLSESSSNAHFTPELSDNRIHGTHAGTITVPDGAAYLYFDFSFPSVTVKDCYIFQFLIKDLQITCATSALDANSKSIEVVQNRIDDMHEDISNLKDQMQGVQDSVDDLNQGIQDSNEKLDGIQDSMDDANDKLDGIQGSMDDANDKLDDLPGEIGDEFQNVMDAEKDQAGAAGNEFVDQILDVLPDSSTEILGALKGLTDAMSYTGTEAIIPIPGITLPGIDGLIPRTQIWGGVDFDLGEYVAMMPDKLLSLVRSLFTIAIVLYCAYELKGIVSYCLTLKENKGG